MLQVSCTNLFLPISNHLVVEDLLKFTELGNVVIQSRTKQLFKSLVDEESDTIGIKQYLLGYKALTEQYGSLIPDASEASQASQDNLVKLSSDISKLLTEISTAGDSRERHLDPTPSPRTHTRLLELEESKRRRQQEEEARRVQEEKEKRRIQEEQERQREIARIANEKNWSYEAAERYFNEEFARSSNFNVPEDQSKSPRSVGKLNIKEPQYSEASKLSGYSRFGRSPEDIRRALEENERERRSLEAKLLEAKRKQENLLQQNKLEQDKDQRTREMGTTPGVEFETFQSGDPKIHLVSKWKLKQGLTAELHQMLQGLAQQVEAAEENTLMFRVHVQRRVPLDTYHNAIVPQPNPIKYSLHSEVIFQESYRNAEAFSAHVKGPIFTAFREKTLRFFKEDPMQEGWPLMETNYLQVESGFSRY